jgi:glycosyltransferase involved in cell wall biosynthesis
MIVAHLGPASARQGGPAGYIAQLAAAIDAHGSGPHTVVFPPQASETATTRSGSGTTLFTALRRLRRTLVGAPAYYRPPTAQLVRVGGHGDALLADVWASVQADAGPALSRALEANADVLFAHDPPTAEAALTHRVDGREVWLMMHSPMPLALYLVWCWGVPEDTWQNVRSFPDVQSWIARELRVMSDVDRLLIPCQEAAGELVRVFSRFEQVMGRATYLMTGAAGPLRRSPELARDNLRRQWGLPIDRPVGLFIGNAQPYRGLDLLLVSLAHLTSGSDVPGVVAVAGCPPDRLPYHPRLRALGHVRDVSDLLAAVDFVINVNRFSLFDLSTIEAAEAGRPLLLSPVGGNLTFRDLGAGCLMLDELTPRAIADGIARMFRLAPGERNQLGLASRTAYERHLTPRHLRDRHMSLYEAALPRARAVGR